jgi:hypothetical protein
VVTKYLSLSKQEFIATAEFRQDNGGYIAHLGWSAFQKLELDSKFNQIHVMGKARRLVIDLNDSGSKCWNYMTKNEAILALFIHCIANIFLHYADLVL